MVHQRPPTVELLPTGRSLSAATGPVGGGCHLNDSLCDPFANFIGTVQAIDPETQRIRLIISLFGKETPIELDFVEVQKL